MEFILDCEEIGLTPEKIDEVYYDDYDNEWMINFASVSDLMLFVERYGCVMIIPALDDYNLPILKLTNEEKE